MVSHLVSRLKATCTPFGKRATVMAFIMAISSVFSLFGCGDEGSTGPGGENKPVETGDRITASVINACPNSDNLATTTSWMQCLAGKSAKGTDPGDPTTTCEVRFFANHLAEFTYAGKTYATVNPARWDYGIYSNRALGGQRQFLGSITSDTLVVDAIHEIAVTIMTGATDDDVEIEVFDSTLKRQMLTCKLDGI